MFPLNIALLCVLLRGYALVAQVRMEWFGLIVICCVENWSKRVIEREKTLNKEHKQCTLVGNLGCFVF